MRWRRYRIDQGLGPWAARWDALNTRLFQGHPMLTAAFVDRLLRYFPAAGVHLCVGEDAQGDQAMCLLRPQRLGVWASYLPSQAQISPCLMKGDLDLAGLMRCLPLSVIQLDLLALDPLFHGNGFHHLGRAAEQVPHALTMAVDLGDDAGYWAGRSKKLRDNLRRHARAVETAGLQAHYVETSAPAGMAAAVERYAALESQGWKGQLGTALAVGNPQQRFYADLLESAAALGQAKVVELWFGEQLVASRLLLAGPSMVIALKTCYDQAFKHHAPGRLLLKHVLERAHSDDQGKALEFYTNASADQLAWSTRQREIIDMTVYRGPLWAWLAQQRHQLQRHRHADAHLEIQVLGVDEAWPADVQQFFDEGESRRIAYGGPWLKHLAASVYPGDAGTRVYVLRRDGQVVAALPVRLGASAASGIKALSNFYTAVYAPLVEPGAHPALLAPLLKALCQELPGCTRMRFAPMDPAEPGFSVLRTSLRAAGLRPFDYFCHGNWYEPVSDSGDGYLARREGALRSTINRGEKKLLKAGATIEILSHADEVDRAIAAFQTVYARSWKKPEPYPDFMPGLMRLCAARGWLRVGVVWLGDQPIAAQAWIVANERAEIYKLAYDSQHKALAAGTVLTARLMRHVIDVDRVREIDYLVGDDSYKAQWMSERRERWGLVAYNPRTLRGALGWLRESLARRLKPRREVHQRVSSPDSGFATTGSGG